MLRAAVLLGLLSVYLGAPLSQKAGNSADSLKPLVRVKREEVVDGNVVKPAAEEDKEASVKASVVEADLDTSSDTSSNEAQSQEVTDKEAVKLPDSGEHLPQDLTAQELGDTDEEYAYEKNLLKELEGQGSDEYAHELAQQPNESDEDGSGEPETTQEEGASMIQEPFDEDDPYSKYARYLFRNRFEDMRRKRNVAAAVNQKRPVAATAEDMVMNVDTSKGSRVKRDLSLSPSELQTLLQNNEDMNQYGYDGWYNNLDDLYSPVKRAYEEEENGNEDDGIYEDIPNSWEPEPQDVAGLGYADEDSGIGYEPSPYYTNDLEDIENNEEDDDEIKRAKMAALLAYLANTRSSGAALPDEDIEDVPSEQDPYSSYLDSYQQREQEPKEPEYTPSDVSSYGGLDETWEDGPVNDGNPEYETIVHEGQPGLFFPISKRQYQYLGLYPGVKKRDYNPYSYSAPQPQWGEFMPEEEKRAPSPADYDRLYQLAAALRGSDQWDDYKKKK